MPYQKTKVEKLGEIHEGLLEFVERSIRNRVPYPQIAAAVKEQWDEEVSPQVLSNHRHLVVLKQQEREEADRREAERQAAILMAVAREQPDVDDARIAKILLAQAIVNNKRQLEDADELDLIKERRLHRESEGRMEIERAKLEQKDRELELDRDRLKLDAQNAETARMRAEAELARSRQALDQATADAEAKLGKGESLSVDDINRIRERTFGLPPVEQTAGVTTQAQRH